MGELGECPSSLDEEEQRGRDLTAQLYLCWWDRACDPLDFVKGAPNVERFGQESFRSPQWKKSKGKDSKVALATTQSMVERVVFWITKLWS